MFNFQTSKSPDEVLRTLVWKFFKKYAFFQICDTCGKSFKTKESLRIHQASHVPFEERKTYSCKICGKVLWKSTSHRAHEEKCSAKGCSKHSLNSKENQRECLH